MNESHINVARPSQVLDKSWPEGSTTGRKEDRDEDCHVIRQIGLEGTWKGDHNEKEAGDSEKGVRNQTMGKATYSEVDRGMLPGLLISAECSNLGGTLFKVECEGIPVSYQGEQKNEKESQILSS